MLSFILSAFISLSPAKEFNAKDYCPLITQINFETVDAAIDCLKKKNKKKLFVHSPGGMMDAGDELIKYVNKNRITVLCVHCSSMAAFLWLNADRKELGEGAEMMIHYGFAMLPEMTPLTIEELRNIADSLESHAESYLTCLTEEQRNHFKTEMKKGDYWFNQELIDKLGIKYTLINKPKKATN